MQVNQGQAKDFSSLLDSAVRIGYQIAYRIWRLYLRLFKRETFGAQVAVCYEQQILLVKSSYRDTYSFPGGYVDRGETTEECAIRELREEAGVKVSPVGLKSALSLTYQCGGHIGHDEVYEYTVDTIPEVSIDNREIVFAEFVEMSDALSLPLDEHVHKYIMSYINTRFRIINAIGDRAAS